VRIRGFEDQKSIDYIQTRIRLFSYCDAFVYEGRVVTDTDWGCTLRVGQMLFCNFLIFRSGFFVPKVADVLAIGGLFLSGGPFSIQELLRVGKANAIAEQGQFWRPDNFAEALRLLMAKLEADENGVTFCQPLLTNIVKQRVAVLIQTAQIRIKKIRELTQTKPVVLLLLHLALGDSQDSLAANFLFQVMQTPYFCGFLGSEGQRAYYFVGFSGDKLLYLDPHRIAREQDLASGLSSSVDRFHISDLSLVNKTVTIALSVSHESLGSFAKDLTEIATRFPFLTVVSETEDDLSNASTLSNQPVQVVDGDFLAQIQQEMRDAAQARFADPHQQVGSFYKVDTFLEDTRGQAFSRPQQLL
jgi:hypothetical protein